VLWHRLLIVSTGTGGPSSTAATIEVLKGTSVRKGIHPLLSSSMWSQPQFLESSLTQHVVIHVCLAARKRVVVGADGEEAVEDVVDEHSAKMKV
jgi:hypothetical protein